MISLPPVMPSKSYIDAKPPQGMGLDHHYPTDGRTRKYRTALLLYRRAGSNDKKIVALFKLSGIPRYPNGSGRAARAHLYAPKKIH